jgi:hypothetical protein
MWGTWRQRRRDKNAREQNRKTKFPHNDLLDIVSVFITTLEGLQWLAKLLNKRDHHEIKSILLIR